MGNQPLRSHPMPGEHLLKANPQQWGGIAAAALDYFPPGAIGPCWNVQKFGRKLPHAHEHEEGRDLHLQTQNPQEHLEAANNCPHGR